VAKLHFTARSETLDGNGRSHLLSDQGLELASSRADAVGSLSLNPGRGIPPESDITGRARGSDAPEALGRHFGNFSRGDKR